MSTVINASPIPAAQLSALLAIRDLADPAGGPHAIQLIVDRLERALATLWSVPVRRDPGPRVVSVVDNYDRLRYSASAVTRDSRYSRYLGDGRMLRSHTTARIPTLLAAVDADTVLSVPGLCYRRDVIDRQHVGEPHQMDLWQIRLQGTRLLGDDLVEMIGAVVEAALPGVPWYTVPAEHPYTLEGREIYARLAGHDVEIGECGLAHPAVLAGAGLPAGASGLAMGLGLDRLVMLAKGVDDIRLLRSTDHRVAAQMLDLWPYRPVSAQPPTVRDLSLAIDRDMDAELLGDRVRWLLGPAAAGIEEIVVLSETARADLPESARDRLGLAENHKNVLLRLVIRDLHRTLTATEANAIRDQVYAALHEGTAYEWTS